MRRHTVPWKAHSATIRCSGYYHPRQHPTFLRGVKTEDGHTRTPLAQPNVLSVCNRQPTPTDTFERRELLGMQAQT